MDPPGPAASVSPRGPFPNRGLATGPWGPARWCRSRSTIFLLRRVSSPLLKAGQGNWDLWGTTAYRKAKPQAVGTFRPPGKEFVSVGQGRKPDRGCSSGQARQNPLSHVQLGPSPSEAGAWLPVGPSKARPPRGPGGLAKLGFLAPSSRLAQVAGQDHAPAHLHSYPRPPLLAPDFLPTPQTTVPRHMQG